MSYYLIAMCVKQSVIKEKEMSLTNLSGKLDATIESKLQVQAARGLRILCVERVCCIFLVYEKRLKMVQESLDSSQEKLMENQLSLESKCTTLNETLKRFQEEKAERVSAVHRKSHFIQS